MAIGGMRNMIQRCECEGVNVLREKIYVDRVLCGSMLVLASSVLGDRQGYTPYGYGMDTAVRVRSTVSYGRGWQLLRSRGVGNNATYPCELPQSVSACDCSSLSLPPFDGEDPMPRCTASKLCGPGYDTGFRMEARSRSRAAVVFVIDANASNLRFFYGKNVRKLLASQFGLAMRSIKSLRTANTTLPIHLLLSGVRAPSVEAWLPTIQSLNAHVLTDADLPSWAVAPRNLAPAWGSKWARGSFAKLRALALTQFDTIILLDTDTVAFHPINHLVDASVLAPPAAVSAYKCHPRRELRTSVLVIQPSKDSYERALRLLSDPASAIYDDLGEGSIWRRLYPSITELPIGYAALRSTDLSAQDWPQVHLLHDPNLLRKASRSGWKAAGMAERLAQADRVDGKVHAQGELQKLLDADAAAAAKQQPSSKSNKKQQRRARGKLRRRLQRRA